MSIYGIDTCERLARRLPLVAALAAVCGVCAHDARAATLSVDTCADDNSSHSLRKLIETASNGDTINFANLVACSKITLDESLHTPGHIDINQENLTIVGPGRDQLAIDGNAHAGIFRHHGSGTLEVSGLTVTNGKYISVSSPMGGCIYTKGNLALTDVTVSSCVVTGTGAKPALGAGIYSHGYAHLAHSQLTDNHANNTNAGSARGGGAYVVGNLDIVDSTISANSASAGNAYSSAAGGIFANSNVVVTSSTISGNRAQVVGALVEFGQGAFSVKLANSTVSGNSAEVVGGIYTNVPLELANSTIAFNHSTDSTVAGGLYVATNGAGVITMNSSIVADNSASDGPSDIGKKALSMVSISGARNLINASAVVFPADTITECARLDPLTDNGGPTRTHGLRPLSPAVDGGDSGGLPTDQRGLGRVAGGSADIGAFEWHGEPEERISSNGFDGLCDQ